MKKSFLVETFRPTNGAVVGELYHYRCQSSLVQHGLHTHTNEYYTTLGVESMYTSWYSSQIFIFFNILKSMCTTAQLPLPSAGVWAYNPLSVSDSKSKVKNQWNEKLSVNLSAGIRRSSAENIWNNTFQINIFNSTSFASKFSSIYLHSLQMAKLIR